MPNVSILKHSIKENLQLEVKGEGYVAIYQAQAQNQPPKGTQHKVQIS